MGWLAVPADPAVLKLMLLTPVKFKLLRVTAAVLILETRSRPVLIVTVDAYKLAVLPPDRLLLITRPEIVPLLFCPWKFTYPFEAIPITSPEELSWKLFPPNELFIKIEDSSACMLLTVRVLKTPEPGVKELKLMPLMLLMPVS